MASTVRVVKRHRKREDTARLEAARGLLSAEGFFQENDGFCILTHRSPDGDTIGSAAALCRGLRGLGKRAHVLEAPEVTPRYAPLLEGLTIPAVPAGAAIVSVDLASEELLPDNAKDLAGKIAYSIDHHGSNTRYAVCSYIDPGKAACGELIYSLLGGLGAVIDPKIAEAVYVAISTDTGCFQYSNTETESHACVAELMAAGFDPAPLNRRLFGIKSLRRLQLEARLTSSVELWADGRCAVCRLPRAWVEELALTEDDLDALASFPRAIEGVETGVLLREKTDGTVKISLRTGPTVNASKVCAHLGGGGHPAAAGAKVTGTLDEAAAHVRQALRAEGLEV